MSTKEWLADIGTAAEELGYGVIGLYTDTIELVSRQAPDVRVRIESRQLSGDLLRTRLIRVEHRSGSPYSYEFEKTLR